MRNRIIKQINNLAIRHTRHHDYSVWTPDGRCLEDNMTFAQAEEYCNETTDFVETAIFDTHGTDSTLNCRSKSEVKVLRELTEDECDIEDVGKMYHIRFADGFETDAFEDELTFIE